LIFFNGLQHEFIMKKINKKDLFFNIFNEIYTNKKDEFSIDEIIDATKILIEYSKNDYVDKSFIKNYSNDNRKPLDQIFKDNNFIIKKDINFQKYDDQDYEIASAYSNFQKISNGYL
tara:strand:+ start:374 stop:724 length:351 start_codon:yes stop_codon:yes gene_type:complete